MREKLSVNTYQNLGSPSVIQTISVYDWLKLIKNSEHSELIENVRNGIFPSNVITKQLYTYNEVKRLLPCVTYNFLYDGYKKDANLIESTGLMYIDIDNGSFNISNLDVSKVFAYYRSFGGNGYCILVRVEGLSKSNFKSAYCEIVDDLNLNQHVDTAAIKPSQFNVLSYDSDLFINDNPFVYNVSDTSAPLSIVIEKKEQAYTNERGALYTGPIRYDNINEIEINDEYLVDWTGIEIIKCFIPIKKITSNRNNFLLSYCTNLVYLNPRLTKEKAIEILNNVNLIACKHPVDTKHISRAVNSIFNYHKEGTLKPIPFNKLRKIIFPVGSKLTKDEKQSICLSEICKMKVNKTQNKLYGIIEGWDFDKLGLISQRKIYKNFPINKKSVEKYYKLFWDYIEESNKDYKNEFKASEKLSSESTGNHQSIYNPSFEKTYSDEVVNIKDLLIGLYIQAGEKVDVESILGFMNLLNKSEARISEIVSTLSLVIRENRYFNSQYQHIQIPSKVIQLIREYKFRIIDFLYSEAA